MSPTSLPIFQPDANSITRQVGELNLTLNGTKIKLPLKGVSITSKIADRIAEVTVQQTFHNPYTDPLEAVYTYPLSGGCAVSSFEMKVGDQVITGKVQERQQARMEYRQALQDGKRAALMEQERDDVFTVSVGNLPVGDTVTVTVKYSERLPYFDNGTTELRLPLVVAPRYIPGAEIERDQVGDGVTADTDQVPDASRITPPRLAPGVNPNIDLSINVQLLDTKSIDDLTCSQHATRLGADSDSMTISLGRNDELLDRDFILRWRIAGETIKPRFLVYAHPDPSKPSFGMLSLVPPKSVELATPGRDIIFLLDRSGSMQGQKMVSAVRACSYMISALGPKDNFAVLAFDDRVEWMPTKDSVRFLSADQGGIEAGEKYLRTIDSRGGTELNAAVLESLNAMRGRSIKAGRLPVMVVLTDGEVGNESAILKNIQLQLDDNRIFTVGIDTAVNSGFLNRLAAIAGGTATFVAPGTALEDALNQIGREIGRVLVSGITLHCDNDSIVSDTIAPSRIPELYEGRAAACFFRLKNPSGKQSKVRELQVKGKFADGKEYKERIKAEVVEVGSLAQLWAKAHIMDLEDNYRIADQKDHDKLRKQIVDLSVEHSILTKFTAFVAVHNQKVVGDDEQLRKVVQPVHQPQGWGSVNQSSLGMKYGMAPAPASYGMASSQPPDEAPLTLAESIRRKVSSQDDTWGAPAASWDLPAPGSASAPAAGVSAGSAWGPAPASSPSPAPQNNQARGGSWADSDAVETGSWKAFSPTGGSNNPPSSPPPPQAAPKGKAGLGTPQHLFNQAVDKLAKRSQPEVDAGGSDKVAQAYDNLDKLLTEAYGQIKANVVPDADKIDRARTALLDALAVSNIAHHMPLLQKFLRATLVQLIAATTRIATTSGFPTVSAQLQELGRLQEETWKNVQLEVNPILHSKKKPFWEFSI